MDIASSTACTMAVASSKMGAPLSLVLSHRLAQMTEKLTTAGGTSKRAIPLIAMELRDNYGFCDQSMIP